METFSVQTPPVAPWKKVYAKASTPIFFVEVRRTSEQGILGKAPSFRIKMTGLQLNINRGTKKNSDNGFRIPNHKGQ
jgi:hypothetical protein